MATIDTSIARVTPAATPTATGTTASFTPAIGDLLVAAGCFDNSGTAATVTDTAGGTWVSRAFSDGGADAPTSSSTSAVFTCLVTTSSSRTVTMACTGAFFQSFKVYRVTPGAGGTMSVGATGHAGNASANMTPTAFTSTAAGSTMFVAAACLLSTTVASSSDLTSDTFFNATLDDLAPLSGYKTLGATGSQTFNCSATTTGPWHWGAIEVIETIASSPDGPGSLNVGAPAAFNRGPMGLGFPNFLDPLSMGGSNDSTVPAPPNPDAAGLFNSTPRRRLHWPPRRRPIPPPVPIPSLDPAPPLRVVGSSQSVTSAGATKTIPIPAGCLAGEQFLAFQVQDELGLLADMTAPSGWNLINSATFGAGQCMKVWEKGVTATEPAYTTWGMTTAATGRVSIIRITGRKLSGALGFAAYINGGAGTPVTHTTPAFYTSSIDGDVLIVAQWASLAGVSNTWTLPATYTAIGALTDNQHLSNATGWWGSVPPKSVGAEFYAGQAATTTVGGGDISCAVTISQWLWMPQWSNPPRRGALNPRIPRRVRKADPTLTQAAVAPPTFVPATPPRRRLAAYLKRTRFAPGPSDDDLQDDVTSKVTTRRRISRPLAKAFRRRGDFDPPFPQIAPTPTTVTTATAPRRRLAAVLRRRAIAPPADLDPTALPTPPSVGRRRSSFPRRRPTLASPTPAQATVITPPTIPSTPPRRRLAALLRRRPSPFPPPAQAAPVAPTFVPAGPPRRRLASLIRRAAVRTPNLEVSVPRAPSTRARRPLFVRRPRTASPLPAQAAPVAPTFVPAAPPRRRLAALVRRAVTANPTPAQQTIIVPATIPTTPPRRRLAAVRFRRPSPLPLPSQAAPVAPTYVPAAPPRRRLAGLLRRAGVRPPAPMQEPGVRPRSRRLLLPRWRVARGGVTPIPPQIVTPPTYVPRAAGRRRLAALLRRRPSPGAVPPQELPPRPVHTAHPAAARRRPVIAAGPPIPQTAPPGGGGQPQRRTPRIFTRRRDSGTPKPVVLPPPVSILRGGRHVRRFGQIARRAFSRFPIPGGLAPVRDIQIQLTEIGEAWTFIQQQDVWKFEEAGARWAFSELPVAWSSSNGETSWNFTEPPVGG